jgi:hypothetical protein
MVFPAPAHIILTGGVCMVNDFEWRLMADDDDTDDDFGDDDEDDDADDEEGDGF